MTIFRAWSVPEGIPVTEGPRGEGGVVPPSLTPEGFGELVERLREGREDGLLGRPAASVARTLGRVGRRFLDPGDPLRHRALQHLPGQAGLGPAMADRVLEGMAADWTRERLEELLRSEFPDPEVLDGFRPGRHGRVRAGGPPLIVQVSAGNVPGVSVGSVIRSLLVKSALLVKPGRSDLVLPVLFAEGLREEDARLARALAVVYWPGGSGAAVERAALAAADLVVAYGGSDAIGSLRSRLPPTTPLVSYHHRVAFGALAREVLTTGRGEALAREAARAVALFDQRGCVSPHLFYVETGGGLDVEAWAGLLARELAREEEVVGPPELSAGEASAVHQVRATEELREAAGGGVRVMEGGGGPGGIVLYESDPAFVPSCLGRTVRVKPVGSLDRELPALLEPVAPYLQSVGLEAPDPRRGALAELLARAGASRVTTLRDLPWPPPWWHHDGGGALRSLVRWTDLEGG